MTNAQTRFLASLRGDVSNFHKPFNTHINLFNTCVKGSTQQILVNNDSNLPVLLQAEAIASKVGIWLDTMFLYIYSCTSTNYKRIQHTTSYLAQKSFCPILQQTVACLLMKRDKLLKFRTKKKCYLPTGRQEKQKGVKEKWATG